MTACPACSTPNRAFASYCRNCGLVLPPRAGNWSGYRGSSRRLGVNPAPPASGCISPPAQLRLRLGDACRSILGHDGHVIAVSLSGVVEIADPVRGKSVCRFQVQGPVTAEACLHDGALCVATRGQVSAYSLAAMTLETPRVRRLWSIPVNGTPIHALTSAGERLYVTVASADRRDVHVIERQSIRHVYGASKVSWVAADPVHARSVFLSEEDDAVLLHVDGGELATHPVPLRRAGEHPVALAGTTLFAVFGDRNRLYRIDVGTGEVEEALEEDTLFFALTVDGDAWDRNSVSIDSRGIRFSAYGVRDTFAPHERATKGSPVIVQGCAVAAGMEDGRVLLYNLDELPRHEVWRLAGKSGAPVTALASFDSFIAAGDRDGLVEVRDLPAKGVAR